MNTSFPATIDLTFWDKIKSEYPNEFQVFMEWVGDYKFNQNWNKLFNSETPPKFHDLPTAFQVGALIEFVHDMDNKAEPQYAEDGTELVMEMLEEIFTDLRDTCILQEIDRQKVAILTGEKTEDNDTE